LRPELDSKLGEVLGRLGKSVTGDLAVTKRVSKTTVVDEALARYHERKKKRRQSPYRRVIMDAIDTLGPHAYVNMLVKHLTSLKPPVRTSCGAVQATLRRMEAAGYLTSKSSPSPIPDARHVVVYTITPLGRRAYGDP
jgi:hypothetical protein